MHKKYMICTAIGLLLIAAALTLSIYNLFSGWNAGRISANAWNQIVRGIPESEQIPDYVINPDMDMPVRGIDGQKYIGVLEIPAIDVNLPVIDEWSYSSLKIAPCRYTGSAYLNNMTIAAHNYNTHFGALKNLSPKDKVIFTDMDGNIFRYEVAVVEILQPYARKEMTDSDYDLSLFTCTIGGQYRVTVRCEKLL